LHAALFAPIDHYKNKKSPASQLLRASQLKPLKPENPKKLVTFDYFPEKDKGLPNHCSFQHPQQLIFPSQYPKHIQSESHTNNLHFKKNLARIGRPYQVPIPVIEFWQKK
jgi:hypothetical protein